MIVPGCGEHLITAAQHVLPHDLCRHIGVAWLREIAVRGSADEAAFALRIEPPRGLSVGDDRSHRCALTLIPAWRARLLLLRPLSPSSTLVAAAASVVTITLSGMTLLLIAIPMLAAAHRLRIVLLLWSAGIARAVCRSRGKGTRIRFGVWRR
jgi:hypothetical protein